MWAKITRVKYGREKRRYASDTTDEEFRARSMADEFTIESRTADAIRVRHLAHGHRFIFTVQEHHGRRRLWAGPMMGNAKARLRPTAFEDAARAFAEGEARKAGMID